VADDVSDGRGRRGFRQQGRHSGGEAKL
jgi:hypothetical protein